MLISIPSDIEKAGSKPFILLDQATDHRQYVVRASQVVLVVKSLPTSGADLREAGSIPGLGRSPGGGHATPPVVLPGESLGLMSLAGYSA